MPKTRAPKKPTKADASPRMPAIDPKRVHELLGIPGPYLDVEQPPDRPNALTYWDCGASINTMLAKAPDLFGKNRWYTSEAFAKQSDSWRWRQVTLTAAEPGEPFADQAKKLKEDEHPPLARELVSYLIVLALSTGKHPEVRQMRCRDILSSGRRVFVGHFAYWGLELGNLSDRWLSPSMALASIFVPPVPEKKK